MNYFYFKVETTGPHQIDLLIKSIPGSFSQSEATVTRKRTWQIKINKIMETFIKYNNENGYKLNFTIETIKLLGLLN